MPSINKMTKAAQDQKIIDALGEMKSAATITLDGTVYKAKDLQQQLQAEVDAAKATQSAKNAYAQAVLAEKKVAAGTSALRKSLRAYLVATYGAKSAIVAEFGFTPKETTVDVATKAEALEKRAATIAARKPSAAAPAPVVPAVNSITPKTSSPS
jgi:hypothetical protein